MESKIVCVYVWVCACVCFVAGLFVIVCGCVHMLVLYVRISIFVMFDVAVTPWGFARYHLTAEQPKAVSHPWRQFQLSPKSLKGSFSLMTLSSSTPLKCALFKKMPNWIKHTVKEKISFLSFGECLFIPLKHRSTETEKHKVSERIACSGTSGLSYVHLFSTVTGAQGLRARFLRTVLSSEQHELYGSTHRPMPFEYRRPGVHVSEWDSDARSVHLWDQNFVIAPSWIRLWSIMKIEVVIVTDYILGWVRFI